MKILLPVFIFLFCLTSVFANDCTSWSQRSHTSCVFAGKSAKIWERQCENPCSWRNYGPHCDLEKVCSAEDPNTLGTCGDWMKERNVKCRNPNTGDWEQKWVRVCQIGLATTWCSDERP